MLMLNFLIAILQCCELTKQNPAVWKQICLILFITILFSKCFSMSKDKINKILKLSAERTIEIYRDRHAHIHTFAV